MSNRFESREELAAQVEWFAGVTDALADAISGNPASPPISALDMPDDELASAWAQMEQAHKLFTECANRVGSLLGRDI